MNLLPHVIVLHHIRETFEIFRRDPEMLNFILGGYMVTDSMVDVYGSDFINSAIRWIMNDEFNYCLGYRLDTAKVPNISVMFEGGTENQQFIGEYGYHESIAVTPAYYGTFHASGISDDGGLIISQDYDLTNKLWPGLYIKNNNVTRQVTEMLKNGDYTVSLNSPVTLADGLDSWKIYSSVTTKQREVGVSLDRITIKIYLDVPGDPEACEVVSCIMRNILKHSRLVLDVYGINAPSFSYTAIGKNESYTGQNVWTVEFAISALMTDQWILATTKGVDRLTININGACCGN